MAGLAARRFDHHCCLNCTDKMARNMLAFQIYDGPTDLPACLIAHGLYGSGRNWGVIAKRLSATRTVLSVDMRNHGQSFWADTHSYSDLASDLADVISRHGAPMDVIGHSMGGKAAMMLALSRGDLVNRLLVGDIAPVNYSHTQVHYIHAMRAVQLNEVARRSDAQRALAEQGVEPAIQAFLTQSLDVAGQKWRYNLDVLESEMPKILGFPDVDASWDGRALILSGAQSDYVLPEHRPTFKRLFPAARFAKLPGAGHWLHADKPREFLAAAEAFFA